MSCSPIPQPATRLPLESLEYEPETNTIIAHFSDVAEAEYMLNIVSGTGAFEDIVGNDLDGEPLLDSLDGTPSGDGVAGGDWFIEFNVNISVERLAGFARLNPLGGHAAKQEVSASLGDRELDRYEVFAEAGEIVMAIATPNEPDVRLHINDSSAGTPGESAGLRCGCGHKLASSILILRALLRRSTRSPYS